MSLTAEQKKPIIQKYALGTNDTGSSEVQVALLTERINLLTEHMKMHRKDFHSRRGLLVMIGKRRRLLDYLKRKNEKKYAELLVRLELRR